MYSSRHLPPDRRPCNRGRTGRWHGHAAWETVSGGLLQSARKNLPAYTRTVLLLTGCDVCVHTLDGEALTLLGAWGIYSWHREETRIWDLACVLMRPWPWEIRVSAKNIHVCQDRGARGLPEAMQHGTSMAQPRSLKWAVLLECRLRQAWAECEGRRSVWFVHIGSCRRAGPPPLGRWAPTTSSSALQWPECYLMPLLQQLVQCCQILTVLWRPRPLSQRRKSRLDAFGTWTTPLRRIAQQWFVIQYTLPLSASGTCIYFQPLALLYWLGPMKGGRERERERQSCPGKSTLAPHSPFPNENSRVGIFARGLWSAVMPGRERERQLFHLLLRRAKQSKERELSRV